MTRLQKKCIIVSTGIHLLLGVILIVGPGFLSSRDKAQDLQILDFIPQNAIDGDAAGGGGPRMRPPSQTQPPQAEPTPPPPIPQPQLQERAEAPIPVQPQPQSKPQPVKTEQPKLPKIAKSNPDALETPKPQRHVVVPNTQLVKNSKESKTKQAADKAAQQAADSQRRLANAFRSATRDIKTSSSGGTDIKFNDGFGGTGPAYANWLTIVNSIYQNDWHSRVPSGAADDSASGEARVTIAKDGTVLSARITKSSGNPTVDRYIQATLDHVKFTIAFPETSKDEKTEIDIEFSVKATKQMMG